MDVSTLFLDVAGYTKISESLTRDKVNFIIEKYFSSFLDLIYEHGGDINETAGDGLMIIFQGEPNETAINAALAALKVRDKTREINKELRNRFQPISVNMGINSGEASVGMSRFQGKTGTRMTFTASGPVTNLAARIASAAKDGDILIGAETASRISHEISVYDRGLMNFKNVSEPVRVFSLVHPAE
jgi:class 3 adenylate cyclase